MIITQGTDPTVVAVAGVNGAKPTVKQHKVHAIDPKEINDTNGAGDAFAGGLVAGIVEDKELDTCIDMGHWLAGESIRLLGPSFPSEKKQYKHTS